jgi:hypothetical protein
VFGLLLVAACPLLLALVVRAGARRGDPPVLAVLLVAYALRMVLQLFVRELPIFSYGAGGDCYAYEAFATTIARLWEYTSVRYVTAADMPFLGATTLPPNLYALVVYLNGEPTRTGCVALVAFVTCLTALNLYRLSVELGAPPRPAFWLSTCLLFSPNYLYVTSDMFKDAFVAFFMITALGSSFRLARRFSIAHLVLGVVSLVLLRQVRFYLVFFSLVPLVVGLIGVRGRGAARPMLATAALVALGVAVASVGTMFDELTTEADRTFAFASNADTRAFNARGGSGVTFDDGGDPFGALGPKIVYTVFSPFPWQGGSIALQVGKLEALFFYYVIYRALLAARWLWREDRRTLFMFLSFLVPIVVAYATTMANIGLMLRQRIPVVMVTAWLASLSWSPRAAGARRAAALPALPLGGRAAG